jgi:Putative DNA-binding domain
VASVSAMVLDGIRRLALADLDEPALERLAAHGEDLFVERKQAIPSDGIGRTVAAFANSLGGWLLLGVADNGTPVGFNPPGRADPQAYIGQLLAAEVDPLPPYLAAVRRIKGTAIVVVRVFESADTPHLLRTTGALVIRTPKGTEAVTDQRLLLELARRGEDALLRAMSTRIGSGLITRELATPDHPPDIAVDDTGVAVAVRAALLTLAPQFSDWAIGREAAETAVNVAGQLAVRVGIAANADEPDPRGRGVVARWRGGHHYPVAGTIAIDAGGTVGARIGRDPIGEEGGPNRLDRLNLGAIHQRHVLPLVESVCDVLHRAEATGRSTWRLDITLPPNYRIEGTARTPRRFFASAQLTLPAEDDAQRTIARQWSREYARESGLPEWRDR